MASSALPKNVWTDKFIRPTADQLVGVSIKVNQAVLESAREQLLELEGLEERVEWQGTPWRWTLVYSGAGEEGSAAFAYIVPDPAKAQMCLPLTQEQIRAIPVRKLKKGVRDGIVFARNVAGVWWATYDIPTKTAVADMMELAVRKRKLIAAAREAVGA